MSKYFDNMSFRIQGLRIPDIPCCTLKAYIWNKGEEDIIIDDFRIVFVKGDELK